MTSVTALVNSVRQRADQGALTPGGARRAREHLVVVVQVAPGLHELLDLRVLRHGLVPEVQPLLHPPPLGHGVLPRLVLAPQEGDQCQACWGYLVPEKTAYWRQMACVPVFPATKLGLT